MPRKYCVYRIRGDCISQNCDGCRKYEFSLDRWMDCHPKLPLIISIVALVISFLRLFPA